jgi:AcrR family transcriptional regulator
MVGDVKRPYDNSRREAQVRATRARVIDAARTLFLAQGYPATTIEAIADAADTSLPTLYRQFGSKRELLSAVVDMSFVGDDEPVPFGERPRVRAALDSTDPDALIDAFAVICREVMDRSSGVLRVLDTAALVDRDAAELLADIHRQAHTGRSRIVGALDRMGALPPGLERAEAEDSVYALLSHDVHQILTVERGWDAERYERFIARGLRSLVQ